MLLLSQNVHGYPIRGFIQTEIQDRKLCGYILVEKEKEWVTGWYRDGDAEWSSGDYFEKIHGAELAVINLAQRAARYL